MSEQSPSYPTDQRIDNQDLALEMAWAQKPHWEVEKTAREQGLLDIAEQVGISGPLAAKTVEESFVNSSVEISEPETNDTVESMWSPERIKEFVEKHSVGAVISTSMFEHRLRTPGNAHRADQAKHFIDLFRQFLSQDLAGSLGVVDDEEAQVFSREGISELVTIVPIAALAAQHKEGYILRSGLADRLQGQSVFLYKTMTRGSSSYEEAQREQYGRSGRFTSFAMLINSDEVAELTDQIQHRPEMVRDIMDTVAADPHLDSNDGHQNRDGNTNTGRKIADYWSGENPNTKKSITSRPPYDRWKEINGGVNRIALRTDVTTGPEEAIVLEF